MTSRRSSKAKQTPIADDTPAFVNPPPPDVAPPVTNTTGKYLVLFRQDAVQAGIQALNDQVGVRAARVADFANGADTAEIGDGEAIVFGDIGVAVVNTPPDQMEALGIAGEGEGDGAILAVEPEQYVYAIQTVPTLGYLRGYRAGVSQLVDHINADEIDLDSKKTGDETGVTAIPWDESQTSWGLQATQILSSDYTGKGIRVAVLDTGLDLGHPDFTGRVINSRSFVSGQSAQDGHGHGTHCIGTACGPRMPGGLPRYGIAYEAEIFAGKVLNNAGSGTDGNILQGINWAVSNKCAVISMSLGAPVLPGAPHSPVYEIVARRALSRGTLIVAAASNDSHRPQQIMPVGRPANCPSILAVAALDPNLAVASFSNGGINSSGGEVNIAGPGVAVTSAWPRPTLYRTISGTSMATPHVAGIAALLAQSNVAYRGMALWNALINHARALPLSARDVGRGLVIAP